MTGRTDEHTRRPLPLRLLALLAICVGVLPAQAVNDRVVRVLVTHQVQNPFLPWISQSPATREGYGILLDADRVLTTETLVRNATQVELRGPRSGRKLAALVSVADARLNLSLLRVVSRLEDAPAPTALAFAPPPAIGADLRVLQFDDARNVLAVGGRITEVGVASVPDGPYSLLAYDLLTELNINGTGAPVVDGDKLVGLVMRHQASTRVATMIGAPFIARFIADASERPYSGPAAAGFVWRPLVDPAKRAYLGLASVTGGVQVVATLPGFPAHGVLRPLDVILNWSGHPLDALGYYADPQLGRVEFSHLVKGMASAGDQVQVLIWRDGASLELPLELGGDPDALALVPENVTGARAEYLVAGGLVIRELDMFMLRAYGSEWRAKADSKFLHLYTRGRGPDQQSGDRVVILTGVLPDAINVGYQHLRNQVVTGVNGVAVRNMAEVFAVADRDGRIHRVTVEGTGVDAVLDPDGLAEANARIRTQYRLPALEFRKPALP